MFKLVSLCLFLLITSCRFSGTQNHGEGLYSSRVQVVVAPFGEQDVLRPARPILFFTGDKTSNQICRPQLPDYQNIRESLVASGIGRGVLPEIYNLDEQEDTTTETETETARRNEAVYETVSGGYLKFGLFIGNFNTGVGKNASLVVDSIVYNARARYKNQVFSVSNTVSEGYCNSPILYFVPPGKRVDYRPKSKNPLENLTIYLTGFEVVDNTLKPSRALEIKNSIVGSLSNRADDSSSASSLSLDSSGDSSNSDEYLDFGEPILVIPDYTVELVLRGYFILADGTRLTEFVKRVSFRTQPSF